MSKGRGERKPNRHGRGEKKGNSAEIAGSGRKGLRNKVKRKQAGGGEE